MQDVVDFNIKVGFVRLTGYAYRNSIAEMIADALLATLAVLLRPLARLLLRNGVSCASFTEIVRWVYVDVAAREFALDRRKQSVSRISVLTGLTRKEVVRLQASSLAEARGGIDNINRAARVVSGWVREYGASPERVADLPLDGSGASFANLVKRFSGDMPVRAVLDELIRVGTVERRADDTIRLLTRAYLPGGSAEQKFGILGRDVADLIASIDHNLMAADAVPYFQRKVEYDNLPAESLSSIRSLLATHGQGLLERLDREMSAHDRDVDPAAPGTGRKRAMIGIYYFEEDFGGGED